MARLLTTLIIGALPLLASAQQVGFGQCGGIGWTGPQTCVAGFTCTKGNDYYWQCTEGGGGAPPPPPPPPPPPASGVSTGKTTRYWDCCKSSCAWNEKATVTHPVNTCNAQNQILTDFNVVSGCDGGNAYMCNNQAPWAVNDDLSYGFAAVRLPGKSEGDWCCACYELTFTSGPVNGKKMVVQATNTGGDLGDNHFDLSIPGGGVGIFNGCSRQYNAPTDGWGARYGGVANRAGCDALPDALKPGCQWRFDWFKGADNPNVSFKSVTCPAQLTDRTGCVRK